MDEMNIDIEDLSTDQKIKIAVIEEIANGVIFPIVTRICILWVLTLIVWGLK